MRPIRFVALAATTTVALAIAATPAAQAASAPGAVRVEVEWNKFDRILTGQEYGINAFQAFDPAVAADPAYAAGITDLNPGIVRFHGWESMGDSAGADPRGWIDVAHHRWDAQKIVTALTAYPIDKHRLLLNIPGFPSWMDTDQDGYLDPGQADAYAQFCADLVRIVNVDAKLGVPYWEPTNERDDNYYVSPTNAGQPDRLDELTTIYRKAANAMKAVDPTIKTGGLAFARADLLPQVKRFVAAAVSDTAPSTLDFLSYHFYASGDLGQPDAAIYDRVYTPSAPATKSLYVHTADLRGVLDAASPGRRIPMFLDEYNVSWSWTNNDPRMRDNRGGVFNALSMIYALRAGADATMSWNDHDGVYGAMAQDYTLRPTAHVLQLFNNYARGVVVRSSSTSEAAVVSWATNNPADGSHSLVLVNRTADAQEVDVAGKGKPGNPADAISVHRVSADGYSIASSEWAVIEKKGLSLPANSVTVLTDSRTVPAVTKAAGQPTTPPAAGAQTPDGAFVRGSVGASSTADYTAEGPVDWAVWGTRPDAPLDAVRKASGGQSISALTVTGTPDRVSAYTPDWWAPSAGTWSDGDPVTDAAGRTSAVTLGGPQQSGLTFTVPADTQARTLTVHLGVMGTKGVLRATLSDGSGVFETSADDAAPDVINNSGGPASKKVTLTYRAATAGQTLKVEYLLNWNHWGNTIWLQGATLATADTTTPAQVGEVALTRVDSSAATVRWSGTTDETGVAAYDLWSGDRFIATVGPDVRSYVIDGLTARTTTPVTVVARDAAGNTSAPSAPLQIVTPRDRQRPTTPAELSAQRDGATVVLTWSAAFDDSRHVQYQVVRAGIVVAVVDDPHWTDPQPPSRRTSYAVVAIDPSGNQSQTADAVIKAAR